MQSLESFFRWAFYSDYGTTPERAMAGLLPRKGWGTGCTPYDISTSLFEMSATEMVDRFSGVIRETATAQNIDGRAIAAVVCWEYEENWRGRYSDYFQAYIGTQNSGIGWGSMHGSAVKVVRPLIPENELRCMRLNATMALKLIGEIMANTARLYYERSGGIWINDNPAILSFFYNAGDEVARKSAAKRELRVCEFNKVVELVVSENAMAKWVMDNIARFGVHKSTPVPPLNWYVKAKAV